MASAGGEFKPDDFPVLCETCLGDNPFVRMVRDPLGKPCKICDRPFTVFRWKPGPKARFKKTELCPTCAKIKNVCQTCVLDLEFGLPVQVRDSALQEWEKTQLPESDVGKAFMIEQMERKEAMEGSTYGKVRTTPTALLQALARKQPYYKRNLAHVCTFFAKGECNRGDSCPYRHEMPLTGDLAHQNIKDRFHGQNDPVALKMLGRSRAQEPLIPPLDQSIKTLWIGGLELQTQEADLHAAFRSFADIASIRLVSAKQCAFITFSTRAGAEKAAEKLTGGVSVRGSTARVSWGRRPAGAPPGREAPPPGMHPMSTPLVSNPEATKHMAQQPAEGRSSLSSSSSSSSDSCPLPPPPGMGGLYYASMDPKSFGTKLA